MVALQLALGVALLTSQPTTDFEVFRWSFLPTVDMFRFVLTPPAKIESSAKRYKLKLQGPLGSGTLSTLGSLPTPAAGVSWEVPTLPAGPYTLSLYLLDPHNNSVAEYIDSFNRTIQTWEGTKLGRDDLVYGMVIPPYTPIQLQAPQGSGDALVSLGFLGKSVAIDNATGLWGQVEATPAMTPRLQRVCTACKTAPAISLLAGPMELVVVSSGVSHSSRGSAVGPMETMEVSTTGNLAYTAATWTIGPLSGRTNATYDYDGCGRFRLTLHPTSEPIDSLQLRVPLKLSQAYLTHTVTDYIRENYAGSIPAGEGDVYNTTTIARFQLPGPFVPYIYVGGPERGLAFFAENDKDWIPAEPAYQIVRNTTAGTVELVVNFISANAANGNIKRTRTIEFGLMAAPSKPQAKLGAETARGQWTRANGMPRTDPGTDGGPVGSSAALIGNSGYWGARDGDAGYYPYQHNLSIWDYFGELRGGAPATDFLENDYAQMMLRDCAARGNLSTDTACTMPKDDMGEWTNAQNVLTQTHNEANPERNSFVSTPRNVVPYTNPQSVIWDEATENFMDEWTEFDVADPRYGTWNRCWPNENPVGPNESRFGKLPCPNVTYEWQPRFRRNQTTRNNAEMAAGWRYGRGNATSEYNRNPSESYTDMVMHYTKKMLDSFADGIYYDNVFFTAIYRPAPAGPGYVRDDGTLGAGVDVWGWRSFMRRSAVLQHSMGREHTVLWPHMSTFNVLPIIGWATINYDWEERMAGEYGLDICLPHWSNGNTIMNNDFQSRFEVGCATPGLARDDDASSCTDTNQILAQSSGLQTGTIPYAVSEGVNSFNGTCYQRPDLNKTDCDQWIAKTHVALALPHEVRPGRLDDCNIDIDLAKCTIPGSPDGKFKPTPRVSKVTQTLRKFGYDDPSCDVYRFWEDLTDVLQWTGHHVKPLLVNCLGSTPPGSIAVRNHALVIFASFGPSGLVNFVLNRTTLGIGGNAILVDAVTNETASSIGGNFSIWLNQHDYRMVAVG